MKQSKITDKGIEKKISMIKEYQGFQKIENPYIRMQVMKKFFLRTSAEAMILFLDAFLVYEDGRRMRIVDGCFGDREYTRELIYKLGEFGIFLSGGNIHKLNILPDAFDIEYEWENKDGVCSYVEVENHKTREVCYRILQIGLIKDYPKNILEFKKGTEYEIPNEEYMTDFSADYEETCKLNIYSEIPEWKTLKPNKDF